jgi:peptidoglycan/LPS O-acetylase OafA/YrhL
VLRETWWVLTLTVIWGFSTGLLLLLGFIHLIKARPHIPVVLRLAYPILVAALLMIPAEFLPKPFPARPQLLYEVFLGTMILTVLIPAEVSRRRRRRRPPP